MTIEKTIDLCRESAHSDVVKSVLAAAQFSTAQEVVSKFITETDKNKTEKQVLAVRKYNAQNKRGGNGYNQSYRGRNRYNNGDWNSQNSHRNGGNQNQCYRGNNHRGNNYRNNNGRGNNGRGNYRGNYLGRNNNYNNNDSYGGGSNNVRTVTQGSENESTPQHSLGETQRHTQQF